MPVIQKSSECEQLLALNHNGSVAVWGTIKQFPTDAAATVLGNISVQLTGGMFKEIKEGNEMG